MSQARAPRLIVLATSNPGKVAEVERLLAGLPVRFALLGELVGSAEVLEPFATFRENAAHKALTAARRSGEWALGEDSGLAVDALSGRPGVYSARLAGKGEPDGRRVALLLQLLEGVSEGQRTARFHCAVALASPSGLLGEWEGRCEGRITDAARGEGGFGFDPVFVADGLDRTNSELSRDEKNAVSHRGRAIGQLREALPGLLARQA